ncbi:hypothetical protein JB92DRAFT_2834690 [Gautieria morchelliformis]|nr:hypothetical protein JB92DRAFT_2834690 [Gautieria morchelliformis]
MPFEVPTTEKWSTKDTNTTDFPYTSSSQAFIAGFQKLHLVPNDSTFSGEVYAFKATSEKTITAYVRGLGVKEGTGNVLRWSPAYEEYQAGVIGTGNSTFDAGQSKWTYRVNFTHAFSEPPQVVTCFHHFELHNNKPWRLTCKATDIDKTGFTAHINAWGDTFITGGYLYWFAHPSDRKGVVSGDVTLMDTFRSKGKTYWPSGAFSRKPRICFVGLRYINSDSNTDGVNFGIDYTIEDDHVKFTILDEGRLEGASFSYILIE